MAKREFLMLAHDYIASKHGVAGWMLSEKIDGYRCFWDGGITRGLPKNDVPWANTAKDERYVNPQVCTGLWSRYGNVYHAPDWWLDALPKMPLDGELKDPFKTRQATGSVIKSLVPTNEWANVDLLCFGLVPLASVFMPGQIRNPNFEKLITKKTLDFALDLAATHPWDYQPATDLRFETAYHVLQRIVGESRPYVKTLHQELLPFGTHRANVLIDMRLNEISEAGGEGLVVRNPSSFWMPKRSHQLLKIKKLSDDEATVVGYTTGRETDKGSKLLGLMGALIVEWKGITFELSGFTDAERQWRDTTYPALALCGKSIAWAEKHPGQNAPQWMEAGHFPRGSRVTFKYRGLTDDGVPQEARYWRPECVY
jgi:DNA ligase-1